MLLLLFCLYAYIDKILLAYLFSYFSSSIISCYFCFSGCLIPKEKNFTPQEKADQLLTATDQIKFANRYYELKYPVFATFRNLYLERTLKIPEEITQYTSEQIKQRG
ncbi:hypothetical protein HN51_047391 [Arachis hypogaea]